MRIDFRHGLYRAEIDSITRRPIVAIVDGSNLVTRVTNSPVVWTLAQFDKNYTLAEYKTRVIATLSDLNQAAETWVYVQINPTTGVHTFGVTPHSPTYGPEIPVGVDGRLWFNTVDKVTKRYESASSLWRRTMCLVIGRWDGQTFHSIDFGSTVGLNATDCETGTIVRNAVNRGISDGLHGFLTTVDHLFTDSDNTHDFKLESNITRATAVEPIPAFHVVTYTEFGKVRLADYEDTSDAVIALSTSSAAIGDPVELLLQGKAYNQGLWNWPEVNAALWVGESGKLVDKDPRDSQDSRPSKVPVARVIGKDTILFEQGMGGKGERGERGVQIPATDQHLGLVKLSVPAEDSEQPVAVGINDPILWDHRHPASVIDVAPFEGSPYYSDAQSSIELLARTKLNLSGGNLTGAVSSDVGATTANELPTYGQVKDWVEQEIEPLATYEYVEEQLDERLADRPTFAQTDDAIQSEVAVRPTFDQLDIILEDYYTELQADELLATKVDKVAGKELSTNDLTDPLHAKLINLVSSHYRGSFNSLTELNNRVNKPIAGDYADVDVAGSPVLRYIWDATDVKWEKQQEDTAPLTAAQIKQLYEANANTNAFTDALLAKLSDIQHLATKNQTDAFLTNRDNHTGTQPISTIVNLQQMLDSLQSGVDGVVQTVDGKTGDVVLSEVYAEKIQHKYDSDLPPKSTDNSTLGYSILSTWITKTNAVYICTKATNPAVWCAVVDSKDLGTAAYATIGTADDQLPKMSDVKNITNVLASEKVDKVVGKGLSSEDFTQTLKEKLEALESSHWRGMFVSLTELTNSITDPVAGDYADVDSKGSPILRYIWDATDNKWEKQQGDTAPLTAAQIKQLYEANANTNAFTDALLSKLTNIQALATKNQTDAFLTNRDNHTGTQPISTVVNLQQMLDSLQSGVDGVVQSVDGKAGDVVLTDTYAAKVKHNLSATVPPKATDNAALGYSTLSVWITATNAVYICTKATNPAVWCAVVDSKDLGTAAYATIGTADDQLPKMVDVRVITDTKVDKVAGKGLSSNDLTDPLYDKLVSLETSHYRGSVLAVSALATITNPVAGDYADVDTPGSPIVRYIWDATDNKWEKQQGDTAPLTALQVKQMYESNTNTNAFTDAQVTKLNGIQPNATKNQTDAFLTNRANHTGLQTISSVANLQQSLDSLQVKIDGVVQTVDGKSGNVSLTDIYAAKVKHNLTATIPPTAADNTALGYSILSVWINTDGTAWVCTKATNPAVWSRVVDAKDLGTAAYATIGTAPTELPTVQTIKNMLGTAAYEAVGAADNQLPRMSDVKTITNALSNVKVDKVTGKGLSSEDFTLALKQKLESLEGSHFRGIFTSATHLTQQVVNPVAGDYANVDGGVGSTVTQYIYDADDRTWVPQQAAVPPITASQVKQLYESNPNTNVYDDAAKAVVDGVTAKFDKADIEQVTGSATDKVMSQKSVTDALGNKVDKVAGKGLSDENFTQAEKTKLAGVGDITRDFVNDYLLKRG